MDPKAQNAVRIMERATPELEALGRRLGVLDIALTPTVCIRTPVREFMAWLRQYCPGNAFQGRFLLYDPPRWYHVCMRGGMVQCCAVSPPDQLYLWDGDYHQVIPNNAEGARRLRWSFGMPAATYAWAVAAYEASIYRPGAAAPTGREQFAALVPLLLVLCAVVLLVLV